MGTRTFYPKCALPQAAAIVRELTHTRDLEVVGWRLWRQGFGVAERCWREPLIKEARRVDRVLSYFRLLEDTDRNERYDEKRFQVSERLTARLLAHAGTPLLRRARKACGLSRFGTFIDTVVQIGAGTYRVIDDARDGRTELAALDAGFGFASARRNCLAGSAPWLPKDYRPELEAVSFALARGSLFGDVRAATAGEIQACADQLDRLWSALRAFAYVSGVVYGRRGLGLLRLSALLADTSIGALRGMVVFWVRLQPTLGDQAERFIGEHARTVWLAEELRQSRISVPEIRLKTTTEHWPNAMLAVAPGEAVG